MVSPFLQSNSASFWFMATLLATMKAHATAIAATTANGFEVVITLLKHDVMRSRMACFQPLFMRERCIQPEEERAGGEGERHCMVPVITRDGGRTL